MFSRGNKSGESRYYRGGVSSEPRPQEFHITIKHKDTQQNTQLPTELHKQTVLYSNVNFYSIAVELYVPKNTFISIKTFGPHADQPPHNSHVLHK